MTAISAIVGTIVGLSAQHSATMEDTLLSIVCGGFVYVATIGVLQLTTKKSGSDSPQHKFTQISLEAFGFVLGVSMMLFIAIYEVHSHDDSHHHHHHEIHAHDEHHLPHLEHVDPHINHPGL